MAFDIFERAVVAKVDGSLVTTTTLGYEHKRTVRLVRPQTKYWPLLFTVGVVALNNTTNQK